MTAHGRKQIHGAARRGLLTPEYRTWKSMLGRCRIKTSTSYKHYGARGISVCERWSSFENFLADMGRRPSPMHSIDRIDNDGNYEPGNCRWATTNVQSRNTRRSVASPLAVDLIRYMRRRRSHATDIAWAFGVGSDVVYKATKDLRMPRHRRWRYAP